MDLYTNIFTGVDWGKGKISIQATYAQMKQRYIGGRRFGVHVISTMMESRTKQLNPYIRAEKIVWVRITQDLKATIDTSRPCLPTSFALNAEVYADIMPATTGANISADELLTIGERIWNVRKFFNLTVGYTKADDTLPDRLLTETLQDSAPKGRAWERQPLLDKYYAEHGCDKERMPAPNKFSQPGLAAPGSIHAYT